MCRIYAACFGDAICYDLSLRGDAIENATVKGPTCGSMFPAGAHFCPTCGYQVPPTVPSAVEISAPPPANVVYVEQSAAPPNWAPWIVGIVVVLLVAGGIGLWNMGYLGGAANAPSAS